MRSGPSPTRSRTRGHRTATGPMPVMISRLGRCPCRTSRWWPSSVSLSAWSLSKAATSASTACASSARAPLRKTSVNGSAKLAGWESWKTLVSVTAYHSFGGEVEASNTPTIRRLTPSCRHQLSPIAHGVLWLPVALLFAWGVEWHKLDYPKSDQGWSWRDWSKWRRLLALLWQIYSGTGFPNQFFCDSWVVGFWRGRPWLAGRRIGKKSLDAFSSRFWVGWVTRRGDKCVHSTCRG